MRQAAKAKAKRKAKARKGRKCVADSAGAESAAESAPAHSDLAGRPGIP